MTIQDAPPKAGRREWLGLGLLVLPTFVVAIDLFVLMLALPTLARSLGADSNEQLWTMDMYGFMLAGFLITMGTLGDRIGRRKLLLIGAGAFAVASLLCAYSTSPEMLIAARALLGIAGAALGPSTLGLIMVMFKDPKQMAAAFGLWGSTFTLGAVFGPVIGGAMLSSFWWGSIFLLGVPIMALAVIAGPFFLPEFRNPQAGRIDPPSVILSLVGLLLVVYGIKTLARDGWEVVPVLAVVVGLLAGVLFVRRQGKVEQPLLDLKLFRIRAISTSLLGQIAYSLTGGGLMLMMMLYFQLVHGLSTLEAGLAMVPGMIGGAVGFAVAPMLAGRFKPALVISVGLAVNAIVIGAVFTQIGTTSSMVLVIVGFAVISFCGAPMAGLGVTLAISNTPPEKAGSTGSLTQMANEFGGTLGMALLGTIGAAVYRVSVAGTIPAGVPAEGAAIAGDSIAGAAGVAAGLPGRLGAELMAPAQLAFMNGLHTVAWTASVVLLAAAVMVATRLRHIPPIGQAVAPAATADEVNAPAAG